MLLLAIAVEEINESPAGGDQSDGAGIGRLP
jgi:hypothetical protein